MSRRATAETRDLFVAVGHDLRRAWRPLLLTDLAFKLVAVAVLTPLVGLALRGGIALSGSGVLADQEILYFLLRPLGLLVLVAIAGLSLALVGLEQASLLAIASGVAAGSRRPARLALAWAARRARPTLGLTLRLVVRGLAIAAPFLAAMALAYLGLLREYDINFYLQERPPVFWLAAAIVALLALELVRRLAGRIVGWSLALPLVLFDGVPPRRALVESERRTAGRRASVAAALLAWVAGTALLSLLVPPALFVVGRALVPFGRGNPGLVLALMLLVVALWALANLAVGWLAGASFALLLRRLFAAAGGRPELAAGAERGEAPELPVPERRRLARWGAALAVLVLVAGGAGLQLVRGLRTADHAVVIAHRGASGSAPENTLPAVVAAIEQGADFVEVDVQETADGELAVVHDVDLMKVAGVDLEIWSASWDAVRAVDVGSRFSPEYAGTRVPRLREVLESARGRAKVTIELKTYGHGQRLEQRVIALVEELGVADGVVLMSLDPGIVRTLRALRPDWTVGLLTATAIGDLSEVDAHFLAVSSGLVDRRFVRRAHARGQRVYAWTVNDPVRMFQLLNVGVDGLITDRPALARAVIARRARLGTVERLLVGLAGFFGATLPEPPVAADAG